MPADDHPLTFRRVFVLGGARSGKSAFAERIAAECGEPVLYVATAMGRDEEMAERIARHRRQRPPTWRTIEEPIRVAERLSAELGEARTVVVEDLTLLLSNLMEIEEADAEARAVGEVSGLVTSPTNVILVSNEVGMGLVPPYPLGRHFRDALGRVNQAAAAACDEVFLVIAGITLRLK